MASFALPQASRGLLDPTLRSSIPGKLSPSQPKTRELKNPAFDSHFISRAISRENIHLPLLPSKPFKTRIACMLKTASPVGKEDGKQRGQTEKLGEVSSSWTDYLPKEIQPYAKLARVEMPIGTSLLIGPFYFGGFLIWPFAWSVSLAASTGSLPDVKTLALFSIAVPLLRGAACTINDFFDRDFDRMVERTKQRPIASGAVTPLLALCFYAFQLLLSHGILLQLPNYSPIYEVPFIFLFSTYPLMKRLTYWPQAYLALSWNWGALFGWYAIKGSLQTSVALPLYAAAIFWTFVYETIYSHQDKEDDVKAGVKSPALKFGDLTKQWTTGFAIACISSFALAGYNAAIGWPFYASLAAASAHLAWQIGTVDLSSPADCNRKFLSNKWFAALIFSGILLGRLFPYRFGPQRR